MTRPILIVSADFQRIFGTYITFFLAQRMLKRLNIAENPLNVDFSTPPRDRKLDRLIPLSTLLQYNCLTASSYALMLTVQPSMVNIGQHYSTEDGSLVVPLVCHSSSPIG